MPQPEKVLRVALAILEERGHTKNELVNNEGCVCARGAINKALTGVPYNFGVVTGFGDVQEVAERYLALAIPEGADCHPDYGGPDDSWEHRVIGYNNADSTSAEDVKLWFKRAAELARTERDAAAG